MADKDFVVKNGLVTGANNVTFGTAVTLVSNGNVGIGNTAPANKLVVTGSITTTANISAASVNASTGFYGTVQTATQGTIDHNTLANYVADRHIAHSGVSITAGTGLSGGGTIDASRTLNVTNVPNAITFNNGGAGDVSGTTFNGSSVVTISYNSVGAPSTSGTNASGTWSININGSAASATNASAATNATNFTSTTQNSQFNSIGVNTGASGVAGEIRATDNITAYYSDKRLKTNITPIETPIEKIKQISGVKYQNNELAASFGYNKKEWQVGVIAQEIEKVLPECVKLAPFDTEYIDGVEHSKSGENYLTVQYEKIIPLLIEAIKDLTNKVEILEKRIGE